jgi:Zn-dependent M28 family amino/carboxypeptidase
MKDFLNMSPSESTPRTGRPRARYSIPGGSMGDDFVRVEISARAADELLKGTGNSVNDYLKNANSGQPGEKLQLNGKSISLKTSLQSSQIAVRNILGVIEGNNPDQIIVVGAHYDHMGIGNGYIWNGADDNASGTVGVMTLAKAMMATGRKPEKTIVFALWTAEEEGLLGSRYFVRSPSYPISNLKLNINFDMISRYISDDKPKDVVMTYTASMPIFREFTRTNIKKYNIDLNVDYQPSDNPSGGTDHRSFVEAKIPIIRFKSGHREEYHTPYDELKTINWDIMEKIIKINFLNLYDLANSNW